MRTLVPAAVLFVASLAFSGCASTASTRWARPLDPAAVRDAGPLLVMKPLVEGTASPGNVGRNFPAITQELLARILAIVRERCPRADVAAVEPPPIALTLPRYSAALVPDAKITAEELDAANLAFDRGAAYLLVPTIVEWREMRTDDPVGAFLGSRNQVTIELRLMKLRPAAMVARATFTNHARLTLNQSPMKLLNDNFRKTILQMVSLCG
jgi:hypothetical protein